MAILPHPSYLQPIGTPVVDRGHPLGAHLIAGWVMNTNDYPMELIHQRRATDSFSTGPNYQAGPAGGVINASDATGGSGNASTVLSAGENAVADNVVLIPHSVVARGKMLDTTKANGWIIYNDAWALGQATDTIDYRIVNRGDHVSGSVFVNDRIFTIGVSNDLTNANLYLNGILTARPAIIGPAFGATGSIWEIGDRTGLGQRWQGTIDYVYVFNRVLTASEHAWIHQNPYGFFVQPSLSRWFEFLTSPTTTLDVATAASIASGHTYVMLRGTR